MTVIDDRTPNLSLPLPNPANDLSDDVERIREALTAVDMKITGALVIGPLILT